MPEAGGVGGWGCRGLGVPEAGGAGSCGCWGLRVLGAGGARGCVYRDPLGWMPYLNSYLSAVRGPQRPHRGQESRDKLQAT